MLDSADIAQFLVSGLTTGCGYALVALAIVVMANVSGIVNLAQGEYVAVGGLMLASLTATHVPIAIGLVVVVLVGTVLGIVQERLTVRPVQGEAQFLQISITLGVAVAIRGAAFLIWGKDPLGVAGFSGDDVLVLAGAIFPIQTLRCTFIHSTRALSPCVLDKSQRRATNGHKSAAHQSLGFRRRWCGKYLERSATRAADASFLGFRIDLGLEGSHSRDLRWLPLSNGGRHRRPRDRRSRSVYFGTWFIRFQGCRLLCIAPRRAAGDGGGICARSGSPSARLLHLKEPA
jgi:hypothetical protein